MNIDLGFDLPKQLSSIIKVIGVGGGGGNAVNYMYNQGIVGVDFIVCNTDNQALEMSPVTNKIQIGRTGLGAGANPEIAREAAIERTEDIINSIVPNTKMLFIVAGMGGGTGTGAAPVIADIARQNNILTVGIVTIPYEFEGRRRQQLAVMGVDELRKHVDSLIIIDNNKLRELYGNMGFRQVMTCADQVMSTAAKRIAEIVTLPGYINVDFEDVKTVLKDSKTAIMGYGEASGDNRAEKVIREAIKSPLLNDSEIKGAQKILLHITSGTHELTHDEIDEICSFVYDEAGHQVDIFMGYTTDDSLGENVSVSIIATGIAAKELPIKKHELNGNEDLGFNYKNRERNSNPSFSSRNDNVATQSSDVDVKVHHLVTTDVVVEAEPSNKVVFELMPSVNKDFCADTNEKINKNVAADIDLKRNEMLNSLRDLSQLTPEETDKLHNEPAYIRKNLVLEEVQPSSEIFDSLTLDRNNNVVSSGNRFLNPMVD
ncbi:cell division protein FtsZ [Odoribacter sp. OttesenSCG-928-L07]|nr:cell division protein FtsZ [Odoribacter sp. OttesenSCG-928-L07]MDL2239186.1 cell division protein FtsZ [Bacteroidales bacterium OttesenSCG-928-L14]MDL2240530.1 cell division protein FtsZ [Bacteroidales bacterium OttesenSCG-928-K22]